MCLTLKWQCNYSELKYNHCISLAVLFLEFWKRRQFVLQHDWDVLGYEESEVRICELNLVN